MSDKIEMPKMPPPKNRNVSYTPPATSFKDKVFNLLVIVIVLVFSLGLLCAWSGTEAWNYI